MTNEVILTRVRLLIEQNNPGALQQHRREGTERAYLEMMAKAFEKTRLKALANRINAAIPTSSKQMADIQMAARLDAEEALIRAISE